MNDRELLELAARAARYRVNEKFQSERDSIVDPATASLCLLGGCTAWNSLTDDSHALRLAVRLGLVVTPDRENQRTLVSNSAGHEYCAIYWDQLGEMAATRLAITEAAAEIGKSVGGGE
ncbi:hypothetical protein [Pseudomonas aeruginosa]|uniref:hypothetical protein n=1 Tax=Pseudomonas aeruginosa TaxID=287 RepID=UPI001BA98CF7|nr:hypothetical protein [Pseudomonas aeruginosa]QUI49218.1 hypothetical protein JBL36_23730 [Pseudomonas aeruginosa]QUI58916.1 hypothetical protein JBL37_11110 [Pseudomonas aeruginosa]HCG1233948.1 hypothetical protein [Pseudomonas aeruginosa]